MLSIKIITKIFFKGSYYYLMYNIGKEGFKAIGEMGEAEEENKSFLKTIGKRGYTMFTYGMTGLILNDVAKIGGIVPAKVVTTAAKTAPSLYKLFPWL